MWRRRRRKKKKKKLVQEVKKIVLTADSIVLSIDVFDFLKTNVMWYYGWRRDEGKERIIFFTHAPICPPPSLYDTKICQDDDILTRSLSPDYYAISFWQISSYSTSPTNSHNLNTLPPFFSFLCSGRRRNTTNTHMQTLTHTQETFSMVDTNSLLSFFFLFLADAIVRYCLIFFYFYIHIDLLPIFIINLITVIENPLVFTISLYPLLLHSIFS